MGRRLVIGVGQVYRSDDGVGVAVAERVRRRRNDLEVVIATGEGAALMELWGMDDEVVLVDAVRSGASAGTVHRFHANQERLPSGFFNYSTHAFSVAEAVELSRTLNTLPARLVIYGIEGKRFEAGTTLSNEISRVVDDLVERVLMEFADSENRSEVQRA